NARAFTQGEQVHFAPGQFNPNSQTGQELIAHELAHVVQQRNNSLPPTHRVNGKLINDDAHLEKEADALGAKAANNAPSLQNRPGALATAGNFSAHNTVGQRRAMTQAEKDAAKTDAKNKFTPMSGRTIQHVIGLRGGEGIDGIIGDQTVQAISDWQTGQGIADNGIINIASLTALTTARNTNQSRRHEAIRLVADYHNIDLTANTLTVYASTNATSTTRFEAGQRVIEIGTNFFTTSTALRNEINTQLATADPNTILGPIPWAPTILNPQQVRSAIAYNNKKFNDTRSISVFQNHLGMMNTGTIDEDFVQRVANVQDTTAALSDTDGKIGPQTLRHFFVELRNAGNHNAVINLIVDFYNMPDYGMLTALYFEDDAGFTSNASTNRNAHGPTRVNVRKGLYQSFEGAVHTIRHELEHVRQHMEGIPDPPVREFLGEAVEVMSVGMPHERLLRQSHDTTNAAGTRFQTGDGLRDDAGRLWSNWSSMSDDAKKEYWSRFVQIRRRLRQRVAGEYAPTATQDTADWAAATAAQQADWLALLTNFNGQAKP
ncbi:MAG: DUF4157 domain-containing protein, partial [Marinirhabdus sp.]